MSKRKRRPRHAVITTRWTAEQTCPACGAILNALTGAEIGARGPVVPEPGAYVICSECITINVFGEDLRIRLATSAEVREAPPFVIEMRDAYRRDHGIRRPRWQ
jgi:hypothetical protein